jgi:hypothetical protein
VVVGVIFSKPDRCVEPAFDIGQVNGGKYRSLAVITGMTKPWGTPKNFTPTRVPAGDYIVAWVRCYPGAGHVKTTINGPFAKFRVNAGELVDVGTLNIRYAYENILSGITGKGKINVAIEDANPAQLAEIQKIAPLLMKRLVKRHMVRIGPPERSVSRKGLF